MRTGPAKVLWVTKGLGLGGTEQLVRLCAPRFDRSRFTVEVAYVLPHKDALVGMLQDAGIRVTCLDDGRGWVRHLRDLVRSGGYDLVHTHSPVPAAVARVASRNGTVLVHTEHNTWDRYRLATRVVNATTLGANATVFAVSDGVRESMASSWWSHVLDLPEVVVLHHGIDEHAVRHGPSVRSRARARLGLSNDAPVIGTVGNFTAKKDHDTLLDAFARLRRHQPDARLVLVGTGPLQDHLVGRVGDLGLADRVLFTGPRSDVPDLLPAFDVFALTSVHEGLPIALLEAMASGVACVATPVGGVPEVIHDGDDGLLVPSRQPEAICAAFERLLGDAPLRERLARAGQRRAEAFSLAGAVERMTVAYEQLLAVPAGRP